MGLIRFIIIRRLLFPRSPITPKSTLYMHGTIPTKIGRVIGDLVLHPQYIPRCVNHNLLNGKTPLDLEIPWFSYSAVDFLESFLQPSMTVCEYGSGGSTLFFAKR